MSEKCVRVFEVKEAEKYLRDLPVKDSILNGIKRVNVFKGSDALKHLMNKKGMVTAEAKDIITLLLDHHYIARVKPMNDQYTFDVSYEFNINHEYIWLKEGSNTYTILVSIGIIIFALIIALFPIWPRTLKVSTGYLFYGIFVIAGLLIFISIVRVIVYLLVKGYSGKEFWIFPNLYEDCGVLESFVPFYDWCEKIEEKEKPE
ncbi:translocation protein SEC62 [Nematocida sp. AWRm80]|nr:translocation protein SEC62 [Nematocida sp. AWRm80]